MVQRPAAQRGCKKKKKFKPKNIFLKEFLKNIFHITVCLKKPQLCSPLRKVRYKTGFWKKVIFSEKNDLSAGVGRKPARAGGPQNRRDATALVTPVFYCFLASGGLSAECVQVGIM